jgi:hypothetical protein
MVFPLVVFLTALFSYRAATKDADKKKKRRSFWFFVPSFSGAVLYYLFIIVFVFYGFLGCLFWFTEQTHKIKLHRLPSGGYLKDQYLYMTKTKEKLKKKAIVAIARKLSQFMFAILKSALVP